MEMALNRPLKRGDVCLVQLDPTRRSEIRKMRPCLVISPDDLNNHLRTLIVAPMTTAGHAYPWRVACRFHNRSGFVAVDQIRTIDSERISKRLGRLNAPAFQSVLGVLQEMFSP
jgi:mRNA interferase MazF